MIRLRVTPEVNAIATVVLALTGIMLALFLALVAGRRAPIDRGTRP
jgi:ABC-type spermidine/putrescine transport system permease subunit II